MTIQRYTITPPVEVVHSEDGWRVAEIKESKEDVKIATDKNGRWVLFEDHEDAIVLVRLDAGTKILALREELYRLEAILFENGIHYVRPTI
jgi:hypothetical protein